MMQFLKDNKILFDIDTMCKTLNVPKAKLQRELKKHDIEITKYKNSFLYPEMTLFILMEKIVIEKINKS